MEYKKGVFTRSKEWLFSDLKQEDNADVSTISSSTGLPAPLAEGIQSVKEGEKSLKESAKEVLKSAQGTLQKSEKNPTRDRALEVPAGYLDRVSRGEDVTKAELVPVSSSSDQNTNRESGPSWYEFWKKK
jgi:hypothetical protein